MPITIGVIMDPIGSIKYHKDSTLAMLLAAQRKGWTLRYMEMSDLYMEQGEARASVHALKVYDDPQRWCELGEAQEQPLGDLDVILMRKDPPFDMEYIYATYMLEQAEQQGTLVVNRAASLRDANEKVFTSHFPQCTPPTLISRRAEQLRDFIARHGETILKPLEGMGGASIFRVSPSDPNLSVILENLSQNFRQKIMAQEFIPEIKKGDKRVLIVNGEAIPYCLARIPAKGETRGNIAAGGSGKVQKLSENDNWIVSQISPFLKNNGIMFAGIDIIGDYLTEINITSPTCIREIDAAKNTNIASRLFEEIESHLAKN